MHIIDCAQLEKTVILPLNYLFIAMNAKLYSGQTNEAYPQVPANPGITPNYTLGMDAAERANTKAQFEYKKAQFDNCKNMKSVS